MVFERNQAIGVIEPKVQRHDQTRQKGKRPSCRLIPGETDRCPAAGEHNRVGSAQGHGDDDGVLENSNRSQPNHQPKNQQHAAKPQQPLNGARIENNFQKRSARRWFRRDASVRGMNRRGEVFRRTGSPRLASGFVDNRGRNRLDANSLFFQRGTQRGDSRLGLVHAGVGRNQGQSTGVVVRFDRVARIGPMPNADGLGGSDEHAATRAMRIGGRNLCLATPAFAGRHQGEIGCRLLTLPGSLDKRRPFCTALIENGFGRDDADGAVLGPTLEPVLCEIGGLKAILPLGRDTAGGTVPLFGRQRRTTKEASGLGRLGHDQPPLCYYPQRS